MLVFTHYFPGIAFSKPQLTDESGLFEGRNTIRMRIKDSEIKAVGYVNLVLPIAVRR